MKVEVEFPACFESEQPCPIHIGRLQFGHHVGRLILSPDGKIRIAIPLAALNDGSVLVHNDGADVIAATSNREKSR